MKRGQPVGDDDIAKHNATTSDWDKITALYIRGITPEEICKTFPRLAISRATILKHMSLCGATAKKRAMEDRIIDKTVEAVEQEKLKVNEDCIRLFNTGAKVIEGLLNQFAKEVKSNEKIKQPRATAYNTDMLMSGLTKIQKGLRIAYGMDADGKLYEKEPEVLTIEGIDTGKI